MDLKCPHCHIQLPVSDKYAGHVMHCGSCGGAFPVPAPTPPQTGAHGSGQIERATTADGRLAEPPSAGSGHQSEAPWWIQDSQRDTRPSGSGGGFVGIDFGTTNSSMAWFNPKSGQAEVLLNSEGEDKTPSVVYFGDNETLVGKHAEERLEHPEERKRIIITAKRELAKARMWMIGARGVTAIDVAAEILKKLKRDAEQTHFHEGISRAVITYPAVFDEIEKDRIREAASRAGFQEIELLEEPVAAAMAYAQAGVRVGRYVLVYDLGGGTFDVAMLVREDDHSFRLALEPRGDRIGGEDFDRILYNHYDEIAKRKFGQPITSDGIDLHLLRQCRRYKENLSASEQPHPLSWWWPRRGRVELKLSRNRFEDLIRNQVDRTAQLTRRLCDEAATIGHHAESVILIGGSSRIPLIQRALQEVVRLEPRRWQKQDVAVALGAAYHGEQLWGPKQRREKESPITPVLRENAFEAKYREAVEVVWRKRPFGRDDLERLVLLASQLDLKKGQAKEIEHQIMGGFKEVIFDRQQRASEDEPVEIAQSAEVRKEINRKHERRLTSREAAFNDEAPRRRTSRYARRIDRCGEPAERALSGKLVVVLVALAVFVFLALILAVASQRSPPRSLPPIRPSAPVEPPPDPWKAPVRDLDL